MLVEIAGPFQMKAGRIALVSFLLFAGAAPAAWFPSHAMADTLRQTDIDTAIAFVQESGANRNFPVLLSKVIGISQTGAMLGATHGPAFIPVLQKHAAVVFAERQDEWDRNLAQAHLKYLSSDELESLREQKRNSPHFENLVANQQAIGVLMMQQSEHILKESATKILVLCAKELGLTK